MGMFILFACLFALAVSLILIGFAIQAKKESLLAIGMLTMVSFSLICLAMIMKSYGQPVPFSELFQGTTYRIEGQIKTTKEEYIAVVTGPFRTNLCIKIPNPLPLEATSLQKIRSDSGQHKWEIQTTTEDTNDVE